MTNGLAVLKRAIPRVCLGNGPESPSTNQSEPGPAVHPKHQGLERKTGAPLLVRNWGISQKSDFPKRKESTRHQNNDNTTVGRAGNFQNQHVQCLTPRFFPSLDLHWLLLGPQRERKMWIKLNEFPLNLHRAPGLGCTQLGPSCQSVTLACAASSPLPYKTTWGPPRRRKTSQLDYLWVNAGNPLGTPRNPWCQPH